MEINVNENIHLIGMSILQDQKKYFRAKKRYYRTKFILRPKLLKKI